jgi:antirestriction protein ArdC
MVGGLEFTTGENPQRFAKSLANGGELTAAFLCAHLGIEGQLRHAGYIADWIALLSGDPRAIFTAASKASQAADFLRRFSEGDVE